MSEFRGFDIDTTVRFDPVDQCIYCDDTEGLSDEHIVPYGLSGNLVLPKASCGRCQKITAALERDQLRGFLRQVRIYRDLKSRSGHRGAPKSYEVGVVRGGEVATEMVPLEDYPIILTFPVFSPPAFIHMDGYSSGIRLEGVLGFSFGKSPDEVVQELGADDLRVAQEVNPVDFARMIAKIAVGFAYAMGYSQRLKEPPTVRRSIVRMADDVGMWVGSYSDPLKRYPGQLHRVGLHAHPRGFLHASVQLFADSGTPAYGVVLGEMEA